MMIVGSMREVINGYQVERDGCALGGQVFDNAEVHQSLMKIDAFFCRGSRHKQDLALIVTAALGPWH